MIDSSHFKRNFEGFRIADSHFKLGSRLHIRDYFYAKRIFYNSFYTNRFAFLLADYILQNHFEEILIKVKRVLEKKKGFKELNDRLNRITLIGYEEYSNLLVSNIRKLLNQEIQRIWPEMKGIEIFNHNVFTKNQLFTKDPNRIAKELILIFPISTTFSTTIRAKNQIEELLYLKYNLYKKEKFVFLEPFLNCLVIANETSFLESSNIEGHRFFRESNTEGDFSYHKDDIEYEYGWKTFNRKTQIVAVQPQNNGKPILQLYLSNLDTKWEKIYNCSSCFPKLEKEDIYLNEKCLLEVDDSSLNPKLTFRYPKTQLDNSYYASGNIFHLLDNKVGDNSPIILRHHFKKYDSHYIYFLKMGNFFNKNESLIIDWLEQVNNNHFDNVDNTVIVTPIKGSGSGFVNLVNEKLFSDTATIIQYDPNKELLHNFKIFYQNIINSAESVVFVDDVLGTAKAFSAINFFIRNTRRKKSGESIGTDKRGVDYCICLVNKLGYYNQEKLLNKIPESNFLTFSKINVEPIPFRESFPYVQLEQKFKKLNKSSVLDMMRVHFKKERSYFKAFNLVKSANIPPESKHPKNLLLYLIQHEINLLFQYDQDRYINELYLHELEVLFEKEGDIDHLIKILIEKESSSIKSFLEKYIGFEGVELRNAVLKVVSTEPYVKHNRFKQIAFRGVLKDLLEIVKNIPDDIEKGDFFEGKLLYSYYQRFKFLLKRGAKLNINYIFSLEVLRVIKLVLDHLEKEDESTSISCMQYVYNEKNDVYILDKDNTKRIDSIGFITYYVALIQELILDHEDKAIQLVQNVVLILQETDGKNLRNTYNTSFIYLLRLLVLENTFIFEKYSNSLLSKKSNNITFKDIFSNGGNYSSLESAINKDLDENQYGVQASKHMLNSYRCVGGVIEKGDIKEIDSKSESESVIAPFKAMLKIKALTKSDYTNIHSIENSENIIGDKINEILSLASDILGIEEKGGAFLAFTRTSHNKEIKEKDIVIIDQKGKNFGQNLPISNSLTLKVFKGLRSVKSKKPMSTFEVSRHIDKGEYEFKKVEGHSESEIKSSSELLQNINYDKFLFIRVSEIETVYSDQTKRDTFIANPLAVICFYDKYNDNDENTITEDYIGSKFLRFSPKQVRLLLLVRDDMRKFLLDNFRNDSLPLLIDAERRHQNMRTSKHIEKYLFEYLSELINDTYDGKEEKKKELEHHLALLATGRKIGRMIFKDKKVNSFINEEPFNIKYVLEYIHKNVFTTNYNQNVVLDSSISFDSKGIDLTKAKLDISESLFQFIFHEVLLNCKKAVYYLEKGKNLKDISVKAIEKDDFFFLTVTNHFDSEHQRADFNKYYQELLEKQSYLIKEEKGLYLNFLIFDKVLKTRIPSYEIKDDLFSVTYTFRKV